MKVLLAALLLLAIPATATADTLIGQEWSSSGLSFAGKMELAQTFVASTSVRVREFELRLFRDGTFTAPLVVQLVEGIWPSGAVKRTASVPVEAVPDTTDDWVRIRFSSGLRLVPGQHYSIVLSAPGLEENGEDLYSWMGAYGVRPHNSPYELGFAVRADRYPEQQFMSLGDFDFAFRVLTL